MKNIIKIIVVITMIINCSSIYAQVQDSLDCKGAVGDVKYSLLALDKFQKENGDCWVRMEGQNIASSKLSALADMTHLPDARGLFIRTFDTRNGDDRIDPRPFGSPVGDYQADAVGKHSHAYKDTYMMTDREYETFVGTSKTEELEQAETYLKTGSEGVDFDPDNEWIVYFEKMTEKNVGTETRPKNITLHTYIRIN